LLTRADSGREYGRDATNERMLRKRGIEGESMRDPWLVPRAFSLLLTLSAPVAGEAQAAFPPLPITHGGARVTIVAGGLHDPRGLALGPRGALYVAEAGTDEGVFVPPPPPAPTEPPTRDRCEIRWPVGPVTPGNTARISRIERSGAVVPVVVGSASSANNLLIGGDRLGLSAVALVGRKPFALRAGGGCARGHPEAPNGLLRVGRNGSTQLLADLGAYLRSSVDSKDPASPDFEPDGVWHSLVWAFGAFYAVEPNHGILVRVDRRGRIERVADLIAAAAQLDAAHDGDRTFTAMVAQKGSLYISTLGRIDTDFAGDIYRVSPRSGAVEHVATGLHGVLGIAFGRGGALYALETTKAGVAPPLSDPSAGRLVRLEPNGALSEVVTGLAFPAGLLAGAKGELYVSNCSYHCDDGSGSLRVGQVLREDLP
jgi:hypothetical protein